MDVVLQVACMAELWLYHFRPFKKTWFTPRYYGYICWVNCMCIYVQLMDTKFWLLVYIYMPCMHGTEHTILKLTPSIVLWCMAFKVHYDHNSYSTIIVTLTGNSSLALYKQALCSCHCRLIAFTLQFASSFFYLSDEHYPERLPNYRE